ncbi:MAG: 50S ribosomal protein L18Ae [Candidatus Nanohaloarchaea archaeon]
MPRYKFSGEIEQGRGTNPFEREVEAESLKHAREKIYSSLGSEHSVPRSKIEIEESEEV